MNWRTICHPDALNDWRANDEAAPAYDWQGLNTFSGETNNANDKHTVPKEQEKPRYVLPRHIEEAILSEVRRCRTLREEGKA